MSEIVDRLRATIGNEPGAEAWLSDLPARIGTIADDWRLDLGSPFLEGATCSWVAPGVSSGGEPIVLKIGFPHMEARDEAPGLAHWAGDPTVRLLRADTECCALLLERCNPGTPLSAESSSVQDTVIAECLLRLWREAPATAGFRPLAEMITFWLSEASSRGDRGTDRGLLDEAGRVARTLDATTEDAVLLATDLHAGNVLRAEREPWLVIDPKPFVGDRCYDGTQHLMNCRERMERDPVGTVERFAARLAVDPERLRRWTFFRFAISSERVEESVRIARALAD